MPKTETPETEIYDDTKVKVKHPQQQQTKADNQNHWLYKRPNHEQSEALLDTNTKLYERHAHRCNARMDDILVGITSFKLDGSIGRFFQCMFNKDNHELLKYTHLDQDDIERSLNTTILPIEYFNVKSGYGSDRDKEIVRQYFQAHPQEARKRNRQHYIPS